MRNPFFCVGAIVLAAAATLTATRSHAAEGSSVAGVSGGSDMRAAHLPPPGLYAAGVFASSRSRDFYDGSGRAAPFPVDLAFTGQTGAFALLYVPDVKGFGGSFGLLGTVSRGRECGRLTVFTQRDCKTGWGDPYVEVNWSRFFGKIRPSEYEGAFPIAEGLAVQFGLGVVIPKGQYDATEATTNGLSIGNNIWNIAPMAALTYTTPPIIAEGTEFSAKAYWNNYRMNDDTQYQTGDILSVDFAITERIGRIQVGLTGLYGRQIEDDQQLGFALQPDGRRLRGLSLGPVIAFDVPEFGGSLKIKAMKSVIERNTVASEGVVISYGMKLF